MDTTTAESIALTCINVLELLPEEEKVTKLSQLADGKAVACWLTFLKNTDYDSKEGIYSVLPILKIVLSDHFTSSEGLINWELVCSGNSLEITKLVVLLLYISILAEPKIQTKLTQSPALNVSVQTKLRYLFESVQKSGSGLSARFLQILVTENLEGKGQLNNSYVAGFGSPILLNSPNGVVSSAPLRDFVQSPPFRMQKLLNANNNDLKNLRDTNYNLEYDKQDLENNLEVSTKKNQKQSEEILRLKKCNEEFRARQDELEQIISKGEDAVQVEASRRQKELSLLRKENNNLNASVYTLTEQNNELTLTVEQLRTRSTLLQGDCKRLEDEVASLEHWKRENDTVVEGLHYEINDLKVGLQEAQRMIQENCPGRINRTIEESFEGSFACGTSFSADSRSPLHYSLHYEIHDLKATPRKVPIGGFMSQIHPTQPHHTPHHTPIITLRSSLPTPLPYFLHANINTPNTNLLFTPQTPHTPQTPFYTPTPQTPFYTPPESFAQHTMCDQTSKQSPSESAQAPLVTTFVTSPGSPPVTSLPTPVSSSSSNINQEPPSLLTHGSLDTLDVQEPVVSSSVADDEDRTSLPTKTIPPVFQGIEASTVDFSSKTPISNTGLSAFGPLNSTFSPTSTDFEMVSSPIIPPGSIQLPTTVPKEPAITSCSFIASNSEQTTTVEVKSLTSRVPTSPPATDIPTETVLTSPPSSNSASDSLLTYPPSPVLTSPPSTNIPTEPLFRSPLVTSIDLSPTTSTPLADELLPKHPTSPAAAIITGSNPPTPPPFSPPPPASTSVFPLTIPSFLNPFATEELAAVVSPDVVSPSKNCQVPALTPAPPGSQGTLPAPAVPLNATFASTLATSTLDQAPSSSIKECSPSPLRPTSILFSDSPDSDFLVDPNACQGPSPLSSPQAPPPPMGASPVSSREGSFDNTVPNVPPLVFNTLGSVNPQPVSILPISPQQGIEAQK